MIDFSIEQKEKETLLQFWHTRGVLAAKCEFGERTDWQPVDREVHSEIEQQNCAREFKHQPKLEPHDGFQFAVAYTDWFNQHKHIWKRALSNLSYMRISALLPVIPVTVGVEANH